MRKVRNGVIVIVLCIIAGYGGRKHGPLALIPPADGLRDSLAGNPNPTNTGLHLSNNDEDQLHDSVAGSAIPSFAGPHGNTEDQTAPPPRGGDHTGIGPLNGPNPGSQLSPFGPTK
jgi:hypothetical protein